MDDKLKQIQKLLDAAEGNLHSARNMLRETLGSNSEPLDISVKASGLEDSSEVADTTIIEGVFNGEEMLAADGKNYPVPANYASKSKLVEGDGLKLTIAADGSFVYKQIKPIERRNIVGTLAQAEDGFSISAEGKNFKVLTASITFYKAEPGDTVTAIIPVGHDATWAAMENIVTKAAEASVLPSTGKTDITAVGDETTADPAAMTETAQTDTETGKADLDTREVTAPEPALDEAQETPPPVVLPGESLDATAPALEVPDLTPTPLPETPNDGTPEIVMPENTSGASLSDEQLLENLKANLQKIDSPATDMSTPAMTTNPLAPGGDQTIPAGSDQPISELDI